MSNLNRSVRLANSYTADWAGRADYSGNAVFSGAGYYLLGLMLAAAASGKAKDELEVALAVDQVDAAQHLRQLTDLITGCDGVSQAVGLWLDPELEILADYAQLIAPATTGSIPQDLAILDEWVKENTQGILDKFPVEPDDNTLMLLATVLAAKADWKEPFDQRGHTWMGERYFEGGLFRSSVNVDLASIVSYERTKIGRLVCETVAGFDVHLLVGEPSDAPSDVLRAGIAACSDQADVVTGSMLSRRDGAGGLMVKKVQAVTNEPLLIVSAPQFEVTSNHDLLEIPELFGLATATDSSRGHFPGLSPSPLAVQKASQTATAAFSADGFEAAAITVMAAMAGAAFDVNETKAQHIIFTVDRPFGFLAVDRYSSLVLFAGWVASPSQR